MDSVSEMTVGQIITIISSAGGGVIAFKMASILFASIKKIFTSRTGFTDLLSDPERRKEDRREKSPDDTATLTIGKYLTIQGETCKNNHTAIYTDIEWIKKECEENKEDNRNFVKEIRELVCSAVKQFNDTANRIDQRVDNILKRSPI